MKRKILEPKRDGILGEWKRIHKEELYVLYYSYSGDQVKRMRWAGNVDFMGVKRGAYISLVGKST